MASEDPWTIPFAPDAINITLAAPDSFPAGSKMPSFKPALTYQLFENDAIYGYKGLSIDLDFRQDDMSPALNISFESQLPEASSSSADSKVDDVEGILKEHLPEGVPNKLELKASTFKPPGKSVHSYTHKDRNYEIFHANLSDPECRQLLRNFQILVLFFIEAGSTIDLDDEDWVIRRWEVFFLYERLEGDLYSFVGYCTVHNYHFFQAEKDLGFSNLTISDVINKTDHQEQFRSRISQFIILPPYQKTGHGRRLYDTIIAQFLANPNINEITVEDPSDVFEQMRDVADYHRLKNANLVTPKTLEARLDGKQKTRDWITAEKAVAKMPQRQFMRIVEILLLEQILLTRGSQQGELLSKYTYYVKERLYRHNKDVLIQLERDERSEKLAETYENVYEDYENMLKRVGSDAVKGKQRSVISGKRPSSNLRNIAEGDDEEEEELQPPTKKSRLGP